MQIENEVKLDFKDVLIKPKWSTLDSRKNVNINRTFTFKNSGKTWTGVPIIAANMDGVGTFSMAKELSKHNCMVSLHKHYPVDQLVDFWANNDESITDNVFYTIGMTDLEVEKFKSVKDILHTVHGKSIQNISIDVANGYQEKFIKFVGKFREDHPETIIMAGNVVSAELVQTLVINAGVDIVKIGIGGGCFVPGSLVNTENGLTAIEKINIGDKVLTHMGRYMPVTNKFTFSDKKEIVNINNIKATPNHEFYVLHKKFKDIVNEHNIHEYAEWIEAKHLTKEYFLIKHT